MNEFGKKIRQKLEQQQFSDADKHWIELEERLDVAMPIEKKKRRFFWLFFALLGALGVYYFNDATHNNAISSDEFQKNIITKKQVEKTTRNETIELKKSNANASFQNFKLELSKPLIAQKEELASSGKERNSAVKKYSVTKIIQTKTKGEEKKGDNNLTKNRIEKLVGIADDSYEEKLLAASYTKPTLDLLQTLLPSVSEGSKVDENISEVVKFTNDSSKNTTSLNTNTTIENAKKGDDYSRKKRKLTPSFNVSVLAGAMYIGKQIYNVNNVHSEYLNRRKLEEKNAVTATFGVDANVHFGKWIFTSGVNYHSQSEIRNYDNLFYRNVKSDTVTWTTNAKNYWTVFIADTFNTFKVKTSIDTGHQSIQYFDGVKKAYVTTTVPTQNYTTKIDTVVHYKKDSVFVQTDSSAKTNAVTHLKKITDANQKYLTGKNRISYVEIPLLIGYQISYKKIGITLKTGIAIGILSNQKTYYLSNDMSAISEISVDTYRKIIYNYLIRVGTTYAINNKWGLVFEPNYRVNLTSVVIKSAPFQQKYWNLGGNIGLNYKF